MVTITMSQSEIQGFQPFHHLLISLLDILVLVGVPFVKMVYVVDSLIREVNEKRYEKIKVVPILLNNRKCYSSEIIHINQDITL